MNAHSERYHRTNDPSADSSGGEYLIYGLVAEQVERFLDEGTAIDVSGLVRDYPHLERQIRELIPSLAALHRIGPTAGEKPRQTNAGYQDQPRTMLGDFSLIHEIGRGGMGVVYEALQVSLGRRVALKVLPFAAVLDQRQLQRFKNEAQAAAALHHPHIVPVFAVGCERGVHYYAMQFIEGRDLSAAIAQLRQLCGDSPAVPAAAEAETRQLDSSTAGGFGRSRDFYRTVADIGAQAAEALEYAHQRGIVHRDIKPSNLLLDSEGKIWITDFGLAQIETDATLTGTGDLVGTLRYMSPEQVSGHPTDVDHRSDIFALGATLYELATLRPLYQAETRAELLRERTQSEPVSLRSVDPSIPVDLETIILKAISKTASGRYTTAAELAADLRRFLSDQPISARRPTVLARVANWSERHRKWVTVAAVLIGGGLVFAAGIAFALRHQPPEPVGGALARSMQPVASAASPDVPQPAAKPDQTNAPVVKTPPYPQANAAGNSWPTALEPMLEGFERAWRETANISPLPANIIEPPATAVAATDNISAGQSEVPDGPPFIPPAPTPPPPLVFGSNADRDAYVQLVELLLRDGLGQTGSVAVEEAEQHAEAARRLCDHDPRLEYALGLVTLKNFRPAAALEHFHASDSVGDGPFLAAQQTEVWHFLSRKEYEPGLAALSRLAQAIGDSPASWPDPPTRIAAAYWVGRVVGFVQGPGRTREVDELLKRPELDFRSRIGTAYEAAFDAGFAATAREHRRLQAEVDDLTRSSQAALIDKRQDQQAEIAERREKIEGKQGDIQRDAKQWKEWLDDQTQQADETLDKLEKEYVTLEEQAKMLQRSIQSLAIEINMLTKIANGSVFDPIISSNDAFRELILRNEQLKYYQTQLNSVSRKADMVSRNAQTTLKQRRKAAQRYENETGEFVQQQQRLQRWAKRLQREEKRLKGRPITSPSAELTAAKQKMVMLRSYIDLDWERERNWILSTYETDAASQRSSKSLHEDRDTTPPR